MAPEVGRGRLVDAAAVAVVAGAAVGGLDAWRLAGSSDLGFLPGPDGRRMSVEPVLSFVLILACALVVGIGPASRARWSFAAVVLGSPVVGAAGWFAGLLVTLSVRVGAVGVTLGLVMSGLVATFVLPLVVARSANPGQAGHPPAAAPEPA